MIRPRHVLVVLAVPVLLSALAALFMAWLVSSGGGLRFAARTAQHVAGAALQLTAPEGTLLGPLRIARFSYRTGERLIEASDVELRWQPRRLLDGQLFVDSLTIGALRVANADDERKSIPVDLALPLRVSVLALHVDRLSVGKLVGNELQSARQLTQIEARFASDGQRHTLERLHLRTARLAIDASAVLDGRRPFPLAAAATVSGAELGHPFSVDVSVGGTLGAMTASAQSTSARMQVDANAIFDVFAPQPLLRGTLAANGLDPAAWVEGAMHARLQLHGTIVPEPGRGGNINGEISIVNGEPGPLDSQRIPLRRLDARGRQEGNRIVISAFSATLDGGKASGSGSLEDGHLALEARLAGVDAAAWHKSLKRTRLSGALKARLSVASQALQADLADPRFTLKLDAARKDGVVHIQAARLAGRGGSLEMRGRVVPQGLYEFEGSLRRFDPADYFDTPHGRLNAALQARGQLGAQPAIELHFSLRDSRFAGRPLAGQGDLVWRAQAVERADVTLRAGDNQIVAKGRLARPGDVLALTIDAPRLEQIGLGGALQGEAKLSGRPGKVTADWSIRSRQLSLPAGIELQQLASHGSVRQDGEAIRAQLAIGRLTLEGRPPLANLSLAIDGRRSRHRLRAAARVGENHDVELAGNGGLDRNRVWKGSVEQLEWRGTHPLRLVDPAALEAASGHVVIGPAAFRGKDWHGRIDGLSWQPGQLQSAGRFSGLPIAELLADAAPASSLRLGGEWNIGLGQRAGGRLRVFRQEGDLILQAADETFSLGLRQLDLAADFKDRTLQVSLHADGTQAGRLAGQLSAGLAADALTLARHAPWHGKLDFDTPSLGWLSPLLGENILLGGRLRGNVDVRGTPAAPAATGEMTGNEIRLRLLDYGVDLAGGALRLQFTPETAQLQRLEFLSVATQRPSERRIDFRRLAADPGRLVAEGEIALKSRAGRIRLQAQRVAVSQLPNRWLMASGRGDIRFAEDRLSVGGDVQVDAAYIELAPVGRPSLAEDVVVIGRKKAKPAAPPVRLDLKVSLGENFYFRGAGIESMLRGALRLSAERRDQLRAVGSVQTLNGSFDAYGTELAIERGILNFQGLIDNPGLNVRALRKNQRIEAGVEVTGLLKNPTVRLVSVPDVPDSEKLSWMLLGRGPGESLGARDADLLLSAAMALRGGSPAKGPLQSLTKGLGLEELSLGSGTLGETSRFPATHVAGRFEAGGGATAAEQIATVGKRIGSKAVLAYERSVTSAESVVKLTVELTQRLSIVGRVGADNAIGLIYSFSFGEKPKKTSKALPRRTRRTRRKATYRIRLSDQLASLRALRALRGDHVVFPSLPASAWRLGRL